MTPLAAAFIGCMCGMFLACKALNAIAQRDAAVRDRNWYQQEWLNVSHDYHALAMACADRAATPTKETT